MRFLVLAALLLGLSGPAAAKPVGRVTLQAMFEQAEESFNRKRYAEAESRYRAVIRAAPADKAAALSSFRLGMIRMAEGKPTEARTRFRSFLDRYPQSDQFFAAKRYLMQLDLGLNRLTEADRLADEIVPLADNFPSLQAETYRVAAQVKEKRAKPAEAVKLYDAIARLPQPSDEAESNQVDLAAIDRTVGRIRSKAVLLQLLADVRTPEIQERVKKRLGMVETDLTSAEAVPPTAITEETPPVPERNPPTLQLGLGLKHIEYAQDQATYLTEMAGTLLGTFDLHPFSRRIDIELSAQLALLPFSASQTTSLRSIEADALFGFSFPASSSLWSFRLAGGLGYATSLVENRIFGYRSLLFLEVMPSIRRRVADDGYLSLAVKLAPLASGAFNLNLGERDWLVRLLYEARLEGGNSLFFALEGSNLRANLSGLPLRSTRFMLSVGYGLF